MSDDKAYVLNSVYLRIGAGKVNISSRFLEFLNPLGREWLGFRNL